MEDSNLSNNISLSMFEDLLVLIPALVVIPFLFYISKHHHHKAKQPPEGFASQVPLDVPWLQSSKLHALEHRALLADFPIYTGHTSHIPHPGSYASPPHAPLPIFLIRGKDSRIRTFHNVCRHRAYTVVRKERGKALVVRCRYHGWCYDWKGSLVKAPSFELGDTKEENRLWVVKTKAIDEGILVSWFGSGVAVAPLKDLQLLEKWTKRWDIKNAGEMVKNWSIAGRFNWKVIDWESEPIITTTQPNNASSPSRVLPWLWQQSERGCHLRPFTKFHAFGRRSGWLAIVLLPTSATTTAVHFELHQCGGDDNDDYSVNEKFVRKLEEEMQMKVRRWELKQEELEYDDGTTTRAWPKSHQWMLPIIRNHLKLEQEQRQEIHPAAMQKNDADEDLEAIQLCKDLERPQGLCSTNHAEQGKRVDLIW
ncbi:MAG: hypothetical protein M1834_003378 [Cirrosporium novae-zelandiae]|nr:MAG: hypothetical protein M1834_003378 [Cirrosporium novae-zelandiae]